MTRWPRAVLVDLDDTLFPQAVWLAGAWSAVARAGAAQGCQPGRLRQALVAVAAEGSDRGGIIDRALAQLGADDVRVEPLVAAFREHAPTRLPTYPGVTAALSRLRRRVPVGLISDGVVPVQEAKLAALGLTDAFDTVVLSDRWGREHRKPAPRPFRAALAALGCRPVDAVVVGDRPAKDVRGAARLGIRAVRVRTGEYAGVDCDPPAWRELPSASAALSLLAEHADGRTPPPGR